MSIKKKLLAVTSLFVWTSPTFAQTSEIAPPERLPAPGMLKDRTLYDYAELQRAASVDIRTSED